MSAAPSAKTGFVRKNKLAVVLVTVLALAGLLYAAVVANNWVRFSPYRELSAELNNLLGGGFTTSYNWNCGLGSVNCPSVRMVKEASFASNDEANDLINKYLQEFDNNGFVGSNIGVCEPRAGFDIYCGISSKKNGMVVTANIKKDFIGVDIQP